MNKIRLFHFAMLSACLAVIGLGGAGCTTVNPDTVENDFKQTHIYPQVILTDNTEASLKTLAQRANLISYINMGMGMDDVQPAIITEGIHQVLLGRFPQSGNPSRSNLVMVFDAQVKLGSHSGATTSLELSGTFKDGNQTIETVTSVGTSTIPFPAVNSGFHSAADAAFADFGGNLRASQKLDAYLSSNPTPNPSVPAPVIIPPANPVRVPVAAAPTSVPVPAQTPTVFSNGNSTYTLQPDTPPASGKP